MSVVIFEPKFVGHCLGFATTAANAFARIGCDVTLAVPVKAEHTQQAEVKLSGLHPKVEVQFSIDVPVKYRRWENARFESEALATTLNTLRPDQVVAPTADFLLSGLLLNSALRKQLRSLDGADFILHNLHQAYPTMGRKDRMWRWVDRLAVDVSRGIRLHTIDPYASNSESRRLAFLGTPVHPMPYPLESPPSRDKSRTRQRLGLQPNKRYIGSIGDLGPRKGTDVLIRSFARANSPELTLVLYGVLADPIRELLDRHQQLIDLGRIVVRDEFVPEEDLIDFLYAIDIFWAGYPRQIGLASMMLHAAEAGCPVLASDFGCVGWMTREFGLGMALPATDDHMTRALEEVSAREISADPKGTARLLSYHSLAEFEAAITGRAPVTEPELQTG